MGLGEEVEAEGLPMAIWPIPGKHSLSSPCYCADLRLDEARGEAVLLGRVDLTDLLVGLRRRWGVPVLPLDNLSMISELRHALCPLCPPLNSLDSV